MRPLDDWEVRWAPYDETTYRTALSYVSPSDVVLDIGAGDLRFTRRIAKVAEHVFAIEMEPGLLANQSPLPDNLSVICADARLIPWPKYASLGVLLMRHCTHTAFYVKRLRAIGCDRLVTNARWRMDVELMELGQRSAWKDAGPGWYACSCGQTGFIPGPPDALTEAVMHHIAEVETCPNCCRQPKTSL